MRKILILAVTILILFSTPLYAQDYMETDMNIYKGRVIRILSSSEADHYGFRQQVALVEILEGPYKGQVIEVTNTLMDHPIADIELEEGKLFYFVAETYQNQLVALHVSDYVRDTYIYILGALFFLVLLLVGRLKGLKAFLTLVLTIGMIFYFFVPMLLKGYNPVLLAIILTIIVAIVTLTIISGWNKKTLAAILGTSGGLLTAGALALGIGKAANLTGYSSQEAQMLMYANTNIESIQGLLFAGILIGALGAVMDVAMSVASASAEVAEIDRTISSQRLVNAGLNVGKDVMGTMSNTLILAYTGASLPLLLLFVVYEVPAREVINMDLVATEMVRALTGTIGLIITVPLTALAAGMLLTKKN